MYLLSKIANHKISFGIPFYVGNYVVDEFALQKLSQNPKQFLMKPVATERRTCNCPEILILQGGDFDFSQRIK